MCKPLSRSPLLVTSVHLVTGSRPPGGGRRESQRLSLSWASQFLDTTASWGRQGPAVSTELRAGQRPTSSPLYCFRQLRKWQVLESQKDSISKSSKWSLKKTKTIKYKGGTDDYWCLSQEQTYLTCLVTGYWLLPTNMNSSLIHESLY